jgi:basic membrane protein A
MVGVGAALLAATALAACGSEDAGSSGASASGNGDCGYAYVFQDPISADTAEQTIQRGVERAEKDFNIKVDIIDGTGLANFADNVRAAAAKQCYKAIGTAFFAVGDTLTQVAKDYPDQKFFIEGGVASGPNVTSYAEANEQGTYVAGAMAAKMSSTGTIGIITGDDSPPLKRYATGFSAGARAADPNIKVLDNAVGSFTDPAKAGGVAFSQAGHKADIIYSAAGSNLQVYFLGQKHGYRTIASDLTDYATAKPRKPAVAFIAASAEDNVNYAIFKRYAEGKANGTTVTLGLKDGAFAIPYITDSGT